MTEPRPIVIAMRGAARHGKDTVADHLVKNYMFARTGFSYPLKRLCCEQYGWDFAKLNDGSNYKDEQDPNLPDGWTRRKVLCHVGTECFRYIDPLHWVKKTVQAVARLTDSRRDPFLRRNVVVTDVRFPNEVDALRNNFNTYVFTVVCPNHPHDAVANQVGTPHESETAGKDIRSDFGVSVNYGDLDALRALAGAEVERLFRVTP